MDAGEGVVCVGTPTEDVELRCVLAAPGATSLEPEEFASVMELSTRTAAAGMRPMREGMLADADLVLLPLLFMISGFAMMLAICVQGLAHERLQGFGQQCLRNYGEVRYKQAGPTLRLRGRWPDCRRPESVSNRTSHSDLSPVSQRSLYDLRLQTWAKILLATGSEPHSVS